MKRFSSLSVDNKLHFDLKQCHVNFASKSRLLYLVFFSVASHSNQSLPLRYHKIITELHQILMQYNKHFSTSKINAI